MINIHAHTFNMYKKTSVSLSLFKKKRSILIKKFYTFLMMCYHKKKVETNSNKYASFLSFPKYKINAIFFFYNYLFVKTWNIDIDKENIHIYLGGIGIHSKI